MNHPHLVVVPVRITYPRKFSGYRDCDIVSKPVEKLEQYTDYCRIREGGDSRNQLVIGAVDFWNQQLTEIGSGFRLGPVTFISEIIPPGELAELSRAVLEQKGVQEPPPGLMKIDGDLIIALSDGDFVSFTGPFLKGGKHPQLSGPAFTIHQRRSQRHSS
jgi:hypothetical protein